MKTINAFIISLIFLACVSGCKKELSKAFDSESISGLWVPYEIVNTTGDVLNGPFSANSLFGTYAESVKMNPDKTFIPVVWIDSANYTLKPDEKGTYQYIGSRNELVFQGIWRLEFEVTRFSGGELWMRSNGGLHKFRRKL